MGRSPWRPVPSGSLLLSGQALAACKRGDRTQQSSSPRNMAVGLGSFVTPKGWVELANPSSTKISLKLFSLNNCSSKVSSCKSSSEDSLPNFLEIGEFQLALRTLRNEAAFVAPWTSLLRWLRISLSTASSAARISMAWTSLRSSSPSSWTMPYSAPGHFLRCQWRWTPASATSRVDRVRPRTLQELKRSALS